MREEKIPKVSVCVMTYNQEKYIRQCLQSIVDQETDFDFEVIVGDDCSTDGTRAIVQEFADKYLGLVKPIFHEKNIGPTPNYFSVHKSAKGKYVAHVDGDDYALPGKLQAQVDVLDSHPNVSFSVHAVKVVDSERIMGNAENLPEIGTLNDLLSLGCYFVHSSTMYRRENQFNHGVEDIVDYYYFIEHASKGDIFLIKKPLGVYRWHPEGISSRKDFRESIERCYEAAYLRAIELGASPIIVKKAQMAQRKWFALKRLLEGDLHGYKQKIALGINDVRFVSFRHLVLFALSPLPIGGLIVYLLRKKALR